MSQIQAAMDELEEAEARRVLRWAIDKYGTTTPGSAAADPLRLGGAGEGDGGGTGQSAGGRAFERISDLVDAAAPSSVAEYVLVGSYWFQVVLGNENVAGQQVNAEL